MIHSIKKILFAIGLLFIAGNSLVAKDSKKPNILLILTDDLGYGDLQCYNKNSQIPTPHLNKLAESGMRFTDAHSPSTVCTPSRYSLLTGRMQFRTGMKGVFTGAGGPCLIEESRLTLPQMLKEKGYATACVGKWHIGMSFFDKNGTRITDQRIKGIQQIDYSRPIPDGPVNRGFDYFYGTVSCPTTDFLYAYIENDRIPIPPTKILDRSKLPKHAYSHDCRIGMIADNFDHEEADMVFLKKSQDYIRQHIQKKNSQPFFLFHSMQAVHLPSFPAKQFHGKTKLGPHGDFIFQMDHIVGELMKTLEELNALENTIIIFCSDNGVEVPTALNMIKTYNHDGSYPWRGLKRDQWEGGHRTPLIISWPNKIKPSVSNELVSLCDIMASSAALVDYKLLQNSAEDSYNILPVLLNEKTNIRPYLLTQTISLNLAIRKGPWKYLDHPSSGGNNYNGKRLKHLLPEKFDSKAPVQLYNLEKDPQELENLYLKHPEVVKELKAKLDQFKKSGRSN
ncbi:arylsulphatase A [Lentisphaera araneosa HTCC2155]|uniref:Arylsulphatase A n=1 Tax=Lentisphaera araneosa HTCC2155 TaxID=313628 RepID=A6DG73_9BACT|nr:sulfatase-like hydrolase/transferase [Lentisphaera araneosa]EDM29190.1 arylsulphatase A [Lentisphaera araneosa HTCC2155]